VRLAVILSHERSPGEPGDREMDFHAVANLQSWPGFLPSRLPSMGTVSATDLGPHDPTVEHADAVSHGNAQGEPLPYAAPPVGMFADVRVLPD